MKNDPFSARPVQGPYVEMQEWNGQVQLRFAPPKRNGWQGFFARNFEMFPFRQVCLDERGTFFWKQADGLRTLYEIEQQMRKHFHFSPDESKDAVIVFTKMLLRRGLIALKIDSNGRS